jgi:ribonuclease D
MKNYILLLALFFIVQGALAQSENAQSQITDEELEKYAVTMDSVNDMKESLLADITEMVKDNEKITNARYNDLSKIIDDEAALTAAKATPEEIAFIKEVQAKKEEGTMKIQETFQTMAKDYVGASSYNKIKKALESDPAVKQRYETALNKVGGDNSSGVN